MKKEYVWIIALDTFLFIANLSVYQFFHAVTQNEIFQLVIVYIISVLLFFTILRKISFDRLIEKLFSKRRSDIPYYIFLFANVTSLQLIRRSPDHVIYHFVFYGLFASYINLVLETAHKNAVK